MKRALTFKPSGATSRTYLRRIRATSRVSFPWLDGTGEESISSERDSKEIIRSWSSNDATLDDVLNETLVIASYRTTISTFWSKENNTPTLKETEWANRIEGTRKEKHNPIHGNKALNPN
ncbi:hypothetical protein RF11_00988 [Thelohanellus kitauei]|uniref:Uncharacterized protein n=1 Tax=Thelohanellus kitauei TaxID=669202 RepID=A0A0C2MZN2_THEKT|nr:hypothetical protein RF11_00988 [Thelohanellus kitauei]